MRFTNRFILIGLALIAALTSSAQYVQPMRYDHYSVTQQMNVGSGVVRVTAPSAYLEIGPTSGGTKGLLGPRLSTTERNAIPLPADGLLIYNTTTKKYQYYDGGSSTWKDIGSGAFGGSGITQLGTSPWGLTILNDSTYYVDSMKVLTKYQGEKTRDSLATLINARVPSSRNITINGVTLDLSVDRSWTISGTGGSTGIRFDSSYTSMGGSRGGDSFVVKSVRIRRNNATVTPTQTGDSAMYWNIDVPIPDSLKQDGDTLRFYYTGAPDFAVYNPTSVGGSQNLQQTTDLGDSTTHRIVTNDSLKAQDAYIHGSVFVGDTLYSRADSLIAFGTSITAGSGVSSTQRFSKLLAERYGMIEANFGAGGATLNSLYIALYKIPTKTSNRGALMFEYGMNDAATLDTNTFKTRYRVIVDTAIARGWTPNKIILVGGPFSEASLYTHIASYSRATQTVAEEKGTKYFNAYSFMQAGGGTALTADSVHPTALGHAFIFHAANKAFWEFKKTGLVDITGSLIVRKMGIFGSVPATSAYPVGSVAVFNGKTQFLTNVFIGDTVLKGSSAMLNVSTSGGQDGLFVKDNSSLGTAKVSGSEINVIDASNNSTKIRSTSIVVGNGSLSISGSAGRRLMDIGVYGGITVNEDGNTDNFRIEGDNQTHLFYTDGTNDRIGIRTSTPDADFTVNGSVHLLSTVRASGLPTGKQAYQIYADASGAFYRGDTIVGGSGGSGTVTSIATNTGTGITGGTITSSGTLAIDTNLVSTRLWRQKGIDSVQANVNQKLNITDTANIKPRLYAGTNVNITGTYPNLTISSTADTTTVPLITFTAGAGFAADTAMVTDSSLFGSLFTGQYEYTIKEVQAVIKGNSGDSIVLKIVYNDSFNVDGTKINGTGLSLNNRYTGNNFSITTNRTVPVNSWLWMKPESVIAGKKPKYVSVTLLGYKTYLAP